MASRPERRVPGEAGLWVLILGDILIFSLFFLTIAETHRREPVAFRHSQDALDHVIGLANTLVLLTSSLCVALGLHRVRAARSGAPLLLGAAMGLGALFVILKAVEYGGKLASGVSIASGSFFMLYFAFTGIHLMHVLVGIALLAVLRGMAQTGVAHDRPVVAESIAVFWHLVDLLWIVLFALFYLAR